LKPQSLEIWGTKLKPTPREPPMKIQISKLVPEVLFKKNLSTLAAWALMSVSWTNDQMLSVSHPYCICPNLCCWHYISDWKLHFRVTLKERAENTPSMAIFTIPILWSYVFSIMFSRILSFLYVFAIS
jgi:hypothetical protein